jgi:hypothetical protein
MTHFGIMGTLMSHHPIYKLWCPIYRTLSKPFSSPHLNSIKAIRVLVEEEPYKPPTFCFRITAKDFFSMDPGIPKDQLVDPMFLCMPVWLFCFRTKVFVIIWWACICDQLFYWFNSNKWYQSRTCLIFKNICVFFSVVTFGLLLLRLIWFCLYEYDHFVISFYNPAK